MFDFRVKHLSSKNRKNNKRYIRRCALWCTLLFAISAVFSHPVTVKADVLTNESIREKEASIQSSRSQRDKIASTLSDVKKLKQQLESSKANLVQYVTELDAKVTEMQLNIDNLTEQIEQKVVEIEETEKELEAAEQKQQEQYEAMKRRLKFIYEKGGSYNYYLETMAKAKSFADMLNKATYINMMSAYDDQLLEDYTQQTELVKLIKQQLEEEKLTLDDAKAGVEAERQAMEEMIAEKEKEISGISDEISGQAQTIQEYEAQIRQQDNTIAALEAIVAAEKAALAEQHRRHFGGGPFTWPCPGYTYISSEFGNRVHPIYGTTKFHSGLDLAADYGTSILAAYEGTVVAASYDSAMGNYVMIDHGDSLYTIYMHCSALYVSKGQDVTAGQRIAAVGSTGASTGPHLHFSVRLNGSYVSPYNYL